MIFKAAVNIEEQRQRFAESLPRAVDTMAALLDSKEDSVRLRASQIVQERFWGRAQEQVKVSGDGEEPLEIIIR